MLGVLIVDLFYTDVAFGERGSQCNCPVARALSRAWPQGTWRVDGEAARNEAYGSFWFTTPGFDALALFDGGESLTARRFVLVEENAQQCRRR